MRRSMTCKGMLAKMFAFAALAAFVDLGSLGIYGECHTSKFNKDAKDKPERFRRIARTHLSLFRRCLPNTYLVVSDDIGNDGAWGDLKRKDPATGELLDDSPKSFTAR